MPLKILEVIFNLKMKHETVGTIKDFISKKSNLNEFVTLVGDMQRVSQEIKDGASLSFDSH